VRAIERHTVAVLPSDVHAYLSELAARLRTLLDGDLLGVYAGGSIALDAYRPGRSDVDIAAVSRDELSLADKQAIASDLRHESLPCPARGLELVVYAERTVGEPSAEPGFELELNTGSGMTFHAAFDPSGANGRHWYVLDRAILARHGVTLIGPQASALVADVPRELVLPALVESVRWFAAVEAPGDDAVLNACRALRYAAEDRWSSKAEAGRWALGRLTDTELIDEALGARATGVPLAPARVKAFLERTATELGRRPSAAV
jgi:hypothetical protein